MGKVDGCCCGFIFGAIFALLLILGAVFWVCCAVNPQLKESTVEVIDTQISKIKSNLGGLTNQNNSDQGNAGRYTPEKAE